jgi:formylglycine-generating enzyme required for sulfatase activity
MTAPPFSWLHLTDLHQGIATQDWLWPNVRSAFLDDLARVHEHAGPWDVVFFTGDLTQKGTTKEFEQLDETLTQVWERLEQLGGRPPLLAVPGNHDLVRPKLLGPVHKLRNWGTNPDADEELWMDPESEARRAIAAMFAPYQAWWSRQTVPEGWTRRSGILPGDWSVSIPHGDLRIGVIGLNSSYVQVSKGDFKGKLHLDVRQLHAACDGDGPKWAESHDIAFLLTHHGPDWLGPDGREHLRAEIDVPGRFLAHLYGHMHEQRQYAIAEGGAQLRRRWQGPSLFGLEWIEGKLARVHGYTAGRAEFGQDSQSNWARVRLWPRNAVKVKSGPWTLGVDREVEVEGDNGTRPERIELCRGASAEAAARRKLEQVQSNSALGEGVVFAGRFQLLHLLGRGGFAEIWAAYDRRERRPVAVKMLFPDWSNEQFKATRFAQGARQMRRMNHPAIVPIFADVARDAVSGRWYYPMRWLLGGDLYEAVVGERLARENALAVLARALEGLEHAHEQGLIHRDVKPSNVLLDEDGRGWLSDFDLVRGTESAAYTRVSAGPHGLAYIAPEVADGDVGDRRADVYGAGMCVLFVLGGKNPPSQTAARTDAYFRALTCGEGLRDAVRRAVEYDPGARSENCRTLVDALRDGGTRISVVPTPPMFAVVSRPKWAHAVGSDEYGEWAEFRVKDVVQRMRYIAPGGFWMGSPEEEQGRVENEGPQHEVALTKGFWLADSPCTQALWKAVMSGNPSQTKSPERPVETVSWDDVQKFLKRLKDSRLPTEAEWEFACRAGTEGATYAGLALDDIAWYAANSEKKTQIVKQKRPNAWGLYDTLGNVWEWCADGPRRYASAGVRDPVGPMGPGRVARGGSYGHSPRLVRAACRDASEPDFRGGGIGFRLVRGQ